MQPYVTNAGRTTVQAYSTLCHLLFEMMPETVITSTHRTLQVYCANPAAANTFFRELRRIVENNDWVGEMLTVDDASREVLRKDGGGKIRVKSVCG